MRQVLIGFTDDELQSNGKKMEHVHEMGMSKAREVRTLADADTIVSPSVIPRQIAGGAELGGIVMFFKPMTCKLK